MSAYCACHDYLSEFQGFPEKHKARKEHICDECTKIITIGEQYITLAGKELGGDFWRFKMCLECDEVWRIVERILSGNEEEVCNCLGDLSKEIDRVLHELPEDADRCLDDFLALMKLGTITDEELCPGSVLTREVVVDDRQIELQF